ncbi:MAG: universal stress protein [Chloroherpetonaceae bacterium]
MIHIQKILCPIDFSAPSRNALRYANEFAKAMNAKITVMHVIQPQPIAADVNVPYVPLEIELEKNAKDDLARIVKEEVHDGVLVEQVLAFGLPSDCVIAQARKENVDLIILGTHGRTGISRLLMGSTAESVIRQAARPVLVVKASEKEFIS